MDQTLIIPVTVVVLCALVAAAFDVWKFRVPNLLTGSMLVSGFAYHVIERGLSGLQLSAAGILAGFGVLFLLYLVGGVGAGDVKLLAATGAWLGAAPTLLVFGIAGLATALYSVALLVCYGGLARSLVTMQVLMLQLQTFGKHLAASDRVEAVVTRSDRRKRLVPFAAMLALGVVLLLAWQQWLGGP